MKRLFIAIDLQDQAELIRHLSLFTVPLLVADNVSC